MTIPVGFAQTTFNFGGNGLAFPGAIVHGWDPGGGLSAADVAAATHSSFADNVMPELNDDVTLESTLCKFGPDATGPSALFTDPTNGGHSTTGAASNLCYLVRKNTALGGRQGRGRMYLPGVDEGEVGSDGAVSVGQVAALQAALDDFYAALILVTIIPVVLHDDALTPTPMTTAVVQAVAATQRRRMRR